jgi:hypothetical protein
MDENGAESFHKLKSRRKSPRKPPRAAQGAPWPRKTSSFDHQVRRMAGGGCDSTLTRSASAPASCSRLHGGFGETALPDECALTPDAAHTGRRSHRRRACPRSGIRQSEPVKGRRAKCKAFRVPFTGGSPVNTLLHTGLADARPLPREPRQLPPPPLTRGPRGSSVATAHA